MTKPAGTVEVGQEDAKKAQARFEAEVEAELAKRVEELRSKTAMDAADKTALEAAQKQAQAATARLEELAKANAAYEARLKSLEECGAKSRTEEEAKAKATSQLVFEKAKRLAAFRVPKARVEEEAKRLAALGNDAIDEIMRATPAPTSDPLVLALARGEQADEKPDHIRVRVEEGLGGRIDPVYEVVDWDHYAPAGTKGVKA